MGLTSVLIEKSPRKKRCHACETLYVWDAFFSSCTDESMPFHVRFPERKPVYIGSKFTYVCSGWFKERENMLVRWWFGGVTNPQWVNHLLHEASHRELDTILFCPTWSDHITSFPWRASCWSRGKGLYTSKWLLLSFFNTTMKRWPSVFISCLVTYICNNWCCLIRNNSKIILTPECSENIS